MTPTHYLLIEYIEDRAGKAYVWLPNGAFLHTDPAHLRKIEGFQAMPDIEIPKHYVVIQDECEEKRRTVPAASGTPGSD